jgi:hypothetical protein
MENMINDFSEYEKMRDAGASPHEVDLVSKQNKLPWLNRMRVLRHVFTHLSFVQAKEITVQSDGFKDLNHFQEGFVPALEKIAKIIEAEDQANHQQLKTDDR